MLTQSEQKVFKSMRVVDMFLLSCAITSCPLDAQLELKINCCCTGGIVVGTRGIVEGRTVKLRVPGKEVEKR